MLKQRVQAGIPRAISGDGVRVRAAWCYHVVIGQAYYYEVRGYDHSLRRRVLPDTKIEPHCRSEPCGTSSYEVAIAGQLGVLGKGSDPGRQYAIGSLAGIDKHLARQPAPKLV